MWYVFIFVVKILILMSVCGLVLQGFMHVTPVHLFSIATWLTPIRVASFFGGCVFFLLKTGSP